MIKKISLALIFVSLFIALILAIAGFEKVELGTPVLAFLNNTARECEDFKIEIPDIPDIPLLKVTAINNPWDFLQSIFNVLINFTNGLADVINIVILLVNTIIKVLQFFVLMIKNLIFLARDIEKYTNENPPTPPLVSYLPY